MISPVFNGANRNVPADAGTRTPRNIPGFNDVDRNVSTQAGSRPLRNDSEDTSRKSNSSSFAGTADRFSNSDRAMRRILTSQLHDAGPAQTPVPLPGATFGTVALAAAETYGTKFPANSAFAKVNSIGNQTMLDHMMTAVTDRMQDVIDKNKKLSYNIAVPAADGTTPDGAAGGIKLAPSEADSDKAEQEGLHAIARYDAKSGDLIVAYRGTVPVNPSNLLQDAQLAVLHPPKGILDTSTQFAKNTMDQLKEQGHPVNKVILTGHSLGGYIAEYVAANLPHDDKTKVVELGFDAPGLPKSEWQKTADMNAATVSAPGDIVHLFGGNPVGKAITMGEAPSGSIVLQPLVQHMISQILTPLTKQPALANLGISHVSEQSKESLDALASVSADEYKKMPPQERQMLAEGNPEKIVALLNDLRSPAVAAA